MYQKWLDLRDGFEHPEPFHVYYQFGLSWPTSGRSSMSRLLLLNWRATLEGGPVSIPSSVPIIIPASERDLSRRFTVTGFLYKLAWRKHTSFWSQNGWSCFVELIKKITANGEVITNLWPTLQEDQIHSVGIIRKPVAFFFFCLSSAASSVSTKKVLLQLE